MRAAVRHPPAWTSDVALALVLALPVVSTAVADGDRHGRLAAGIAFGVLCTAPLVVRRRWPIAVLAVIVAGALATPVTLPFQLTLMVAAYTVGARCSRQTTLAAAAAVTAATSIVLLARGHDLANGGMVGVTLLYAIATTLGIYVGGKTADMVALRDRAAMLEREQALLAERAVAQERVRIAQELHDVVAHNVSLIVVQAQALGATVPDERVRAATDGIAGLGREAMAEMHRTLKLLRGAGGSGREPQPGLADIDALLGRARTAGVDVQLAVEGAPRPLAQTMDLSAFRIVQEALTNVVKHAGGAPTTVTLTYGADALGVTVADDGDGPGPATPPDAGGHGLVGMRERAALFGGALSAGPRGGRGFEVRASLPYGGGGA
jgi:signal transduction histidine kinase